METIFFSQPLKKSIRPRKKNGLKFREMLENGTKNVCLCIEFNIKFFCGPADTLQQLLCGRALNGMDFLCAFLSYPFLLIFDI